MAICAWCPDFDPSDPRNAGASHGLCLPCRLRMNAECDRVEAERQLTARIIAAQNERVLLRRVLHWLRGF